MFLPIELIYGSVKHVKWSNFSMPTHQKTLIVRMVGRFKNNFKKYGAFQCKPVLSYKEKTTDWMEHSPPPYYPQS